MDGWKDTNSMSLLIGQNLKVRNENAFLTCRHKLYVN